MRETMEKQYQPTGNEQEIQFFCFYLGDTLCGLEIDRVQVVASDFNLTEVPLSDEYILGIMNIRGQIITVIDLRKKMGMAPIEMKRQIHAIIVQSQNEYVGFAVEKVSDVIVGRKLEISALPSDVKGLQGKFFYGMVHTKDNELIFLLDIDKVLGNETE